MKTIALEEHFATQEIMDAWKKVDPRWRDLALQASTEGEGARRLLDLGPERLAAMEQAGIDVAVLSLTTPGVSKISTPISLSALLQTRTTGWRLRFNRNRSVSRALQLSRLLHRTTR